jgi:hypothetical protein
VDFDSTIRRFESSRPSQILANEIRRFLNLPDFHSERRSLPNSERLFPMRSPAHGRTAFWSLMGRGANSAWHSPHMIPSSGAPTGRGLGLLRAGFQRDANPWIRNLGVKLVREKVDEPDAKRCARASQFSLPFAIARPSTP